MSAKQKVWQGCNDCQHIKNNPDGPGQVCSLQPVDEADKFSRRREAASNDSCSDYKPDPRKTEAARSLNAIAFTVGSDELEAAKKVATAATAPDEAGAAKVNKPYDPSRPIWEQDPDAINPYKELPPLQTWCKMGDRPALPKEGITTFSAKQKRGKSRCTYALSIPLLTGQDFDTVHPTDRPKLIAVFDMEMSASTLTERAKRQVKAAGEYGNHFVVFSLKAKSVPDRISTIVAKVEQYAPDIVIIDQGAKLVYDINDTKETNAITDLLDKLSIGRAVWVVMHENKPESDNNMRGHLGSYLSFAAVEAYSVDRKDGVYTITPKEARDTDTENAECVHFALDEQQNIVDASSIFRQVQESEFRQWWLNFRSLFGDDTALRSSEIVERIRVKEGLEERAAKTKLAKARDMGVIRKTSTDQRAPYVLCDMGAIGA